MLASQLDRTRTLESTAAAFGAAELDAWLGMRVGPSYRIIQHIASGGMGHVFLARHRDTRELAAVKVAPFDASPQLVDRILEEAKLLSELNHPHIVRVLETGSLDDESPYVAMEYVPGNDLSKTLDGGRTLTARQALRVLDQTASVVDHLHDRGIVHRDIKPANLLLDPRARSAVKLIDFGIAIRAGARHFDSGAKAGTPGYMAPEQAAGAACGPPVDVYALGALAVELLTGSPPSASVSEITPVPAAMARLSTRHDAAAVESVFERALARDPSARYGSGRELVWALRRALQSGAARRQCA